MELKRIQTNDISQFSDLNEVTVALVGKYLKYKDRNYCINFKGNLCFVHSWGDCETEIPKHYPFKFTDDNGEHTIDESTNNITIKGITQFFFTIKE